MCIIKVETKAYRLEKKYALNAFLEDYTCGLGGVLVFLRRESKKS